MRRDLLYLKDAIAHAERIVGYLHEYDLAALPQDAMRLDAVLRNLQITAEAVRQLPDELRTMRPDIPWTKIAGIRNRLVHHYFVIDAEIVVDICENHLAPLLAALREIASAFPELDDKHR